MPDDRPLAMPTSAPLVGDQGSGRPSYAKRRREGSRSAFATDGESSEAADDYLPTPIEPPDPNQPLYEALDRLRAVEAPVESPTARRARAVKAYQEHTTRSVNR